MENSINYGSGKIYFINESKIVNNAQNDVFKVNTENDESFNELVNSIMQYGLKQPLSVVKEDENIYRLISGHRRIAAIRKIFAENKSVKFGSNELKDKIPCIFENSFSNDDDEFLNLMSSNKYRKLSPEETKAIVKRCKEIFDRKLENKEISVAGTTERAIIADMACIGETSAGKYLKLIEQEENPESCDSKNDDKSRIKSISAVLKSIDKFKVLINELDLDEYGKTDRNTIKESLDEISILCKKKK